MDDRSGKGKFAVSYGPVNRRTVAPTQKAERPASVVLSRLKARQAKHRLGTPLLQRIATRADRSTGLPAVTGALIVQTLGATLGATALFLGSIQGASILIVAGSAILVGAATWAGLQWRNRKREAPSDHATTAWIATSDLERLDTLLEQLAQESEQATIDALCQLKERLFRCVTLVSNNPDLAAPDDTLFVGETVRRYLPDSIQATLKIAPQDRSNQIIDKGKTATSLLHEQLTLLAGELQTRETRLAPLAGEALLQQQRFLAAKAQPAQPLR